MKKLTESEQQQIMEYKKRGWGPKRIAEVMNRPRRTVCGFLERTKVRGVTGNSDPNTKTETYIRFRREGMSTREAQIKSSISGHLRVMAEALYKVDTNENHKALEDATEKYLAAIYRARPMGFNETPEEAARRKLQYEAMRRGLLAA